MKIHTNFDKRVVVRSGQLEWIGSPLKGVKRKSLERIGDEVARASSIVRYATGSHFSLHTHAGSEEFLAQINI